MMSIQLILYDTDEARVRTLEAALHGGPDVAVFFGNGPAATSECELDALWLTAVQGERFGLPIPAPGACVIGRNIPSMLAKGLPPFVIASYDVPGPEWQRDALRVLLKAVMSFNGEHGNPIQRIGTIPENLGITAETLASVVDVLKHEWRTDDHE